MKLWITLAIIVLLSVQGNQGQPSQTCSQIGQVCSKSWSQETFSCMATNGDGCCAFGLACVDSTCKLIDNIGSRCDSPRDCIMVHNERVSCINNICQKVNYVGDKCTQDDDCHGPLNCDQNTLKCIGAEQDQQCACDLDCNYGLFCGEDHTCIPKLDLGDKCDFNNECANGARCIRWNCTKPFSLNLGRKCDYNQECKGGRYCIGNRCADLEINKKCSSQSDCNGIEGSYCSQSGFTGDFRCTDQYYDQYYDACANQQRMLDECLTKNKCAVFSMNEGSCMLEKCSAFAQELNICRCQVKKQQYGDCYVNPICQQLEL